jgi:hypothetical protein
MGPGGDTAAVQLTAVLVLHLRTQYQADEFCLTAKSGLGKDPL